MSQPPDKRSAAQRLPLPEGTLPVGIGLIVAGISSYVFLIAANKALGKSGFPPISSLWFAVFFLAPGFFLPLEQELGRTIAHRSGLSQGSRPVVRRIVPLAAAISLLVVITVVATSGLITEKFFDHDWVITAALIVGFLAYAPNHLARGICSGSGRFGAYGITMGADGATRVVGCLTLWAMGVTSAGAYAFTIALSPLVGVAIVAAKGALKTDPGPPAPWSEVTSNLGWLLLGSVFAAGLINAGPLALELLRGSQSKEVVASFGQGVVVGRVPLFLFQAVQAALLPRLAGLAVRGQFDEFRQGFRRLLMIVIGVGVAGVTCAALLGPFILRKVFSSDLTARTITLLVLGTSIYMIALTFAQAVIALHGHASVAAGWGAGMLTFVLVTWLSSDDLYLRVELGLVASSVASAVFFAFSLKSRLDHGETPDADSMLEARVDLPFHG